MYFLFLPEEAYSHGGLQTRELANPFMLLWVRGTSILGEVRNVEIPGPTQQLLCSKYHDFLAIFALAQSKINQIAWFWMIM